VDKFLVYGSLDFGHVIRDLIGQCGYEFAGFVDDFNEGKEIVGTLEQAAQSHPPSGFRIAIAVGYNNLKARWEATQKALRAGYHLPVLIHPRAYVRSVEKVGAGTIIMAGALIDSNTLIEENVVIWPGAVVSHDSRVGANTFLSPNCTLCGFVTVGHSCFVGAGATITNQVTVPDESFIKAGAVYKGLKH
jgi:sugar O-acyltransferase (sialic acid O-acetyltransferase NeuD family)